MHVLMHMRIVVNRCAKAAQVSSCKPAVELVEPPGVSRGQGDVHIPPTAPHSETQKDAVQKLVVVKNGAVIFEQYV